jgi:hypothetical protein
MSAGVLGGLRQPFGEVLDHRLGKLLELAYGSHRSAPVVGGEVGSDGRMSGQPVRRRLTTAKAIDGGKSRGS